MAIPLYSGRKAQFLEKNGKEGIIREIIKFLRTELRTFSWLKSVTECPEQWITNNLHQYMSWDFMKTRWIKFPKVFMKVKNRFYRKYLPLELYPVLKGNSRGKRLCIMLLKCWEKIISNLEFSTHSNDHSGVKIENEIFIHASPQQIYVPWTLFRKVPGDVCLQKRWRWDHE